MFGFVAPRPPTRDRCSASTVVKVGGMCCVIKTGARSIAAGSFSIKAVSACGPPVEDPISKARGVIGANGRNVSGGASGLLGKPSRDGSGTSVWRGWRASAGAGAGMGWRSNRRRRRPRLRIFSISSRR